jgi:pimeloyl-ACP methyl ester carboxylesterase
LRDIVTEKDATVNGVRVHYAETNGAGKPALVLVPGQSMSWESYAKVIPTLAQRFHVYAVDVRGHGKSEHTPGQYTFNTCGEDLCAFLRDVVKERAIISGNSSGGLICIYAGAHAKELVRAVHAEDPPLFSTEWPRLRDATWVHSFFKDVVDTHPDIARFFSQMKIPQQDGVKLMSFPRPLAWILGGAIRRRQRARPNAPVDIPWLPHTARLFVRGLSEYDVDFTRACVDGRMCDMDQRGCLAALACPTTLIQAASFVHPTLGLVGAMADDDVALARSLLPSIVVEKFAKPHVVHAHAPALYIRSIDALAARA